MLQPSWRIDLFLVIKYELMVLEKEGWNDGSTCFPSRDISRGLSPINEKMEENRKEAKCHLPYIYFMIILGKEMKIQTNRKSMWSTKIYEEI